MIGDGLTPLDSFIAIWTGRDMGRREQQDYYARASVSGLFWGESLKLGLGGFLVLCGVKWWGIKKKRGVCWRCQMIVEATGPGQKKKMCAARQANNARGHKKD